jgi:hypothetical protein
MNGPREKLMVVPFDMMFVLKSGGITRTMNTKLFLFLQNSSGDKLTRPAHSIGLDESNTISIGGII